MLKKITLGLIFIFFSISAFAQRAGTLDFTFGNDAGIVFNTIANDSANAGNAVTIQSDGKIVVAGYTAINNNSRENCAVVRYNINGSLDTTFNKTGYIIIKIGSVGNSYLTSVIVQPNGKILALGSYNGASFVLIRLNINGTLDTSFATRGINATQFTDINAQAFAILLQSDGKIIAGGTFCCGNRFGLARYDTTGELDSTFGTNGLTTASFGSKSSSMAFSLATQSDGKIIASGSWSPSVFGRLGIARFNTYGSLDATFGTDGIDTTNINNYLIGEAFASKVQTDDKILICGEIYTEHHIYPSDSIALARYNSNGGFDTTFGRKGIAILPVYGLANSLILQPDGKIIAAGSNATNYGPTSELVRLNSSNGTLDTSFGIDGQVSSEFVPKTYNIVKSIVLQNDGKIVAAGYTAETPSNVEGGNYFAVARYISGLSTGILQLTSTPTNILIYPNPVHNTETLDYTLTNDETLTINLYDVTGRVIRNYMTNEKMLTGEHKQQLNFENLAAGSYIITISNAEGKMESVKIIKE